MEGFMDTQPHHTIISLTLPICQYWFMNNLRGEGIWPTTFTCYPTRPIRKISPLGWVTGISLLRLTRIVSSVYLTAVQHVMHEGTQGSQVRCALTSFLCCECGSATWCECAALSFSCFFWNYSLSSKSSVSAKNWNAVSYSASRYSIVILVYFCVYFWHFIFEAKSCLFCVWLCVRVQLRYSMLSSTVQSVYL